VASDESVFLAIPREHWVGENALAFAIRDKYPVTEGHTLVIPKRVVATWFDADRREQRAILDLVDEIRLALDRELRPDGYNVGFNAGVAAGQTVMHLHVHVIPRFGGDCDDPRGGVRHVIAGKGNYLAPDSSVRPRPRVAPKSLATGGVEDRFSRHVMPLFQRASEVDILAAFVQQSGVDRIRDAVQQALEREARVRVLTGNYLGITQVEALETLFDWQRASGIVDEEEGDTKLGALEVRVVETEHLPGRVRSFHPKSWRLAGADFATAFVGSSNLSRAALETGIEWNLRVDREREPRAYRAVMESFETLWNQGREIDADWLEEYAAKARERPEPAPPAEFLHQDVRPVPEPHAAQREALARLRASREAGHNRALLVFATGLGKTLTAVLDYRQFWDEVTTSEKPPRLLFLAHRRELLLQAAASFRALLRERKAAATVGWFAESSRELHADVVFASVAKLSRKPHLQALSEQHFDYVVVDEVHHAAADSYRKILGQLEPSFLLGLTATPERADGADVHGLFDDHVAHEAGIDVGIELKRLVPFRYHGIRDTIRYDTIP